MGDHDVNDYLTAWGLGQYCEIFKDNNVTMKAMAVMTVDIAKDLIAPAGDRAIFLHNLEEWRQIFRAIDAGESNPTNLNVPSGDIYSASGSYAHQPVEPDLISEAQFPQNTPQSLSPSYGSTLNEEITQTIPLQNELYALLKATPNGRSILERYQENGVLDQNGRKRLCHLVIDNELNEDPERKITSVRLYNLAHQIASIFKKENLSTYFVPYVSFGPGLRRLAKGKLLDCLNNRRRSLRKVGVIKSTSRRSSSRSRSNTPEDNRYNETDLNDENVTEALNWLHNSSDPWYLVKQYWERTATYRLKQLKDNAVSISDYFKEYPALQKPTGYHLILDDFDIVYPIAKDKLFESVPVYKNSIYDLMKQKLRSIKDQVEKEQVDSFIKCEEGSEDISNLGCFLCLPYLLATTTLRKKKGTWRPSKLEVKEGFVTYISTDSLLQETVARRREKFQRLGLTLQPFIIAVGVSLHETKAYYVIVDEVIYLISSIMTAVDVCFKILMQLNVKYPSESAVVWAFIQEAFYCIQTQYDVKYNTVSSLLSDLNRK